MRSVPVRFRPSSTSSLNGRLTRVAAAALLLIAVSTAQAEEEKAAAPAVAETAAGMAEEVAADATPETEEEAKERIDRATRALLRAADAGSVRRVKQALEQGARINENSEEFAGPDRQPALVAAALSGHSRVVRALIEAGADPMAAEKDGFTAWHGAAFQGRTDVLVVLTELDVPGYDLSPNDGFSPLHRAAWGPKLMHVRAVRFLIGPGDRDCEIVATNGQKPIDRAKHPKIKEMLTECMEEAADGQATP